MPNQLFRAIGYYVRTISAYYRKIDLQISRNVLQETCMVNDSTFVVKRLRPGGTHLNHRML